MVTQKILKHYLSYNSKTGEFIWLNSDRCGWNGKVAGSIRNSRGKNYLYIKIQNKAYPAHRLVFLYCKGKIPKYIDHTNGNSLDNRFDNLNGCNSFQNNQNHQKRFGNSGLPTGVRKMNSKYQARITVLKKVIHLGSYLTISEAEKAYKKARLQYHYCPAMKGKYK